MSILPKDITLVFFGNERLATGVTTEILTLKALIQAGYTVAAVVSNYERGSSRNARQLEIETVAKEHDIPLLLPKKPTEIIDQLRSYNAVVGVLVAYGKIVSQSVIDVFPRGIVNIHPSLLPLHRGPTPIESVILEGATETGVSLMQLSRAMDAGPVYAQSTVELEGNETKQQLVDTLSDVGQAMVMALLPGIVGGDVIAKPQDELRATYDRLLTKDDGVIDWNKPAVRLEREIRAFGVWPKSRTTLAGKDVAITGAHTESETELGNQQIKIGKPFITLNKQLAVQTSKDPLIIDALQPAGKQEMSAQAFIAGYGKLL